MGKPKYDQDYCKRVNNVQFPVFHWVKVITHCARRVLILSAIKRIHACLVKPNKKVSVCKVSLRLISPSVVIAEIVQKIYNAVSTFVKCTG